jgi:hypothetical protein
VSNARLGGKNWMTGYEHQARQVVADVIVNGGVQVRRGHLQQAINLAAKLSSLLSSSFF